MEFDIIPQDTVLEDMTVRDGRAVVNGVEFGVLVVPYSQYLPERVLKAFAALAARKVPVWFVNAIPDADLKIFPLREHNAYVMLETALGEYVLEKTGAGNAPKTGNND